MVILPDQDWDSAISLASGISTNSTFEFPSFKSLLASVCVSALLATRRTVGAGTITVDEIFL